MYWFLFFTSEHVVGTYVYCLNDIGKPRFYCAGKKIIDLFTYSIFNRVILLKNASDNI